LIDRRIDKANFSRIRQQAKPASIAIAIIEKSQFTFNRQQEKQLSGPNVLLPRRRYTMHNGYSNQAERTNANPLQRHV
jgi:hypothetical protein